LAVLVAVKLANVLYWWSKRRTNFSFVPYGSSIALKDVVVTDCTHPKAATLTHHKGHNNPTGLKVSDTSTGIVLNALSAGLMFGGEAYSYCQKSHITTNHFDVDAFLSCWSYINRVLAKQYEPVLRHMARIGDFREAFLSPELVTAHGAEDGITNIREAFTALKLCCWLNTLEKKMFSAPYEAKDCTQKMEYFLPRFAAVLADPEAAWDVWHEEYKQVVAGFDGLQGPASHVERHTRIGLAVLSTPEPLHYYSLFSHSIGCDYVLSMYDHNRYELEAKYTQFVSLHSRPVMPRLDFMPLATVFNNLERGLPEGMYWVSSRFTDTGPVLRLESSDVSLSKAERYGHPCGRTILSSSIPPPIISAITQSFLEYGMQGLRAKRGGFSWDELNRLNNCIPWSAWVNAVLDQHDRGELLDMSPGRSPSLVSRMSVDAVPLEPTATAVPLSEPSHILSEEDVRALAGSVLPGRFAYGRWQLVYCTERDGISLHTLYRKAAGKAPSVLVVKDTGGYVFGALAMEPWKIHTRFYGTGETSVFQLYPRRLLWHWRQVQGVSNDYFQFSTHEGLGVGGSGHFAVWLDNDLFEGSSNPCDTFASVCLASKPDFHVAALELWHVC